MIKNIKDDPLITAEDTEEYVGDDAYEEPEEPEGFIEEEDTGGPMQPVSGDSSMQPVLGSYSVQYTKEELCRLYGNIYGTNPLTRRTIVAAAVGVAFAIFFVAVGQRWGAMGVCLFYSLITLGTPFLFHYLRRYKWLRRKKIIAEKTFLTILYEDFAVVAADDWEDTIMYDDIYRIKKDNDRIYMEAGVLRIVIVPREKVNRNLWEALEQMIKENEEDLL